MLSCGITGASGVLGKRLKVYLPYNFKVFDNDIRKFNEVNKWIDKNNLDIILHLAAIVPTKKVKNNYNEAFNVNVKGTLNLINAILKKRKKPNWFFYASTSHVYKLNYKMKLSKENETLKPQSLYGNTKKKAEEIILKKLKDTSIKVCIGRIFSFTDRKQGSDFVIPSIVKKIKLSKNKKIEFKNLNHYRDFLSTKVIAKYIHNLEKNKCQGVFNIGSGKAFNLKQIASLISLKYKKRIKIIKDNNKPTYLIANTKKIQNQFKQSVKKYENNLDYFY